MASTGSQAFPEEALLLTDDTLTRFAARWDRVQERFVVMPDQAAQDAEALIQDIAEALAVSTVRRRTDLAHVSTGSIRFPEELWITLQRCRLVMAAIQPPARK